MKRVFALAATIALCACPSPKPQPPREPDDTALRIQIAQAEGRRQAGVSELAELAVHGDRHARELAVRGLGRIGGAQAMVVLKAALDDKEPAVVTAAAGAIGVAASLDDMKVDELGQWSAALAAAMDRTGDHRVVLTALGRAGTVDALPVIVKQLDVPADAEAAALALGRYGRRKLTLTPDARRALIKATSSTEVPVRYAATYALGREVLPSGDKPDPALDELKQLEASAIAGRIADEDPEVRAVAIAGLAKRKALGLARSTVEQSLRDRDWRVAVEAVRALAGDSGDDNGRDAVAAALLRRWSELVKGSATEAQIVTEGLRTLQAHGKRPLVAQALSALQTSAASAEGVAPIARGWIECLAAIALGRAAERPDVDALAKCGHGQLPEHLRLPLLVEVAKDRDESIRRAVQRILSTHGDPRVISAGLELATPQVIASTLASKHALLVETALGLVQERYVTVEPAEKSMFESAVVSRALVETDAELAGELLGTIGKLKLASGLQACRQGVSGHPVRAKAARECLLALGEPAEPGETPPMPLPPVDVASVIGKHPRWHLVTTRGDVVIELRPDTAPWNVAVIVALTQKGFYDGIEFHRVVPNFVVQGGDPTMTGTGGPGFNVPAEPGAALDDAFATGGVGIADAGKDSGGSQWFVMHSFAPHLDGRYTWVGVTRDKSADALLIGDKVVKASIE